MKYLVLAAALLTTACEAAPMQKAFSANDKVTASLVTVIENRYRSYRVEVGDRTVFFVAEGGLPLETSAKWTECHPCGKAMCCWEQSETAMTVNR